MRRIALFIALAAFLTCAATANAAGAKGAMAKSTAGKKHRILLQWAEGDSLMQWVMTKHVGNLLDDMGQDNVQLEVIAYGPAVFAITTTRPQTHFADDIKSLTKRGVTFHACHHAMDLMGVKEAELLPEVTPVQGAMSYIVKKYNAGWQILRP